jgi:hypothetical protein
MYVRWPISFGTTRSSSADCHSKPCYGDVAAPGWAPLPFTKTSCADAKVQKRTHRKTSSSGVLRLLRRTSIATEFERQNAKTNPLGQGDWAVQPTARARDLHKRSQTSHGIAAFCERRGVPPPAARRRRPSPRVAVRCTPTRRLSQLAAGGFAAAAGEGRKRKNKPTATSERPFSW